LTQTARSKSREIGMDLIAIGFGIFIATVLIIQLVMYGVSHMRTTQRVKIRKRLRKLTVVESGPDGAEILKKRTLSDIPFLNALLGSFPGLNSLDRLMVQANAKYPMGFYLLLGLFLAVIGILIGSKLAHNALLAILLAVILSGVPYVHLVRMKRLRAEKFKKQMPDGLDLIARSLKAGHAFSAGISMAAEEFDDPLGSEFSEMLDEINFGISVPEALKNLTVRVECEEIKYFVTGVILQRETGGNLAELIQTLANLIREKFKFEGKVRTLSAEGKLSAIILAALPFLVAGWIWLTNPQYLAPLVAEPFGRVLLLLAGVFMIVGILIMKRMVNIKV
jgi:tight adherence protein B